MPPPLPAPCAAPAEPRRPTFAAVATRTSGAILYCMEFEHEFEATLENEAGQPSIFVVLPFSVAEAYGTKDTLPVRAALDGFPYRGTLEPIGDGYHVLLVPKEVRRAVGKTLGDVLHVALSHDTEPRLAELPADLAEALAQHPAAQQFLQSLPYPDQRDYARWLQGAKTPEVRAKRLQETVYRLGQGLKRA